MPITGGYNPVRENLFYIGCKKQSAWGTAVTPTQFCQWLDGTVANIKPKHNFEREGDTQPWVSLVWKSDEHVEIKIKEYARPILAGYALQALLGTGSDAYVAPTFSTTLAGAVNAGDTTVKSTADLGNIGTLAVNLSPGFSSTNYEIVTLDLTSRTTPNYTYTIAASGKAQFAHLSNDPLTTLSTHVMTRQLAAYEPHSIEWAFMTEGNFTGKAFRARDAVCYQLVITEESGKPVSYEHDWYASAAVVQASLLTPAYEGSKIPGTPGSPFIYYQGNGNWSIDGVTTSTKAAGLVKKLVTTIKNSTAASDFLAGTLNPMFFSPNNIDITGQADVIFQSYEQYLETYFGSSTAAATTVDSYIVGTGSMLSKMAPDAVNTLQLSLPYVNYTAAELTPKLDGKPLTQPLVFTASRNPINTTPFTATLTNSQASAY